MNQSLCRFLVFLSLLLLPVQVLAATFLQPNINSYTASLASIDRGKSLKVATVVAIRTGLTKPGYVTLTVKDANGVVVTSYRSNFTAAAANSTIQVTGDFLTTGLNAPAVRVKYEARNRVLLECLLQGIIWRQQATKEGVAINEIARREKIDRRYVAQMIYATFLSPHVVSEILNCKTNIGITRTSLLSDCSYIWGPKQGYKANF